MVKTMALEKMVTGGCLCKAVRYRIAAAPITARLCWCRTCQYFAAGNATVNCCFPSNAITIEGELRDHRSIADSGNVMHRRFCPTCGTHLFSEAESRPHLIFVRAGSLDDIEIAKPAMAIWASAAPSWVCFDPAIPRVLQQPPPAA
jgi:hypothetical protein